jgi:hypothetical protein
VVLQVLSRIEIDALLTAWKAWLMVMSGTGDSLTGTDEQ